MVLSSSRKIFYEASAGGAVLAKMRSVIPIRRHIETSHSPFSCYDSQDLLWGQNKDTHHSLTKINVASFNVLAPCYKRLNLISPGNYARESAQKDIWLNRALSAVQFFETELFPTAHIIGLQEFWLEENYQSLMKQSAHNHGFQMQTLRRTGLKTDAAVFMIHESFEVLGKKEAYLCHIGDRVGLILWLKHKHTRNDIIVANTHLSFPHSEQDIRNQIQQMKILTSTMDHFVIQHGLEHCPKIILGDFNVVGSSSVCDHLRTQGYASCLDVSPPRDGSSDQPVSPVTHLNHRNEELGVDHIFIKQGNMPTFITPNAVSDTRWALSEQTATTIIANTESEPHFPSNTSALTHDPQSVTTTYTESSTSTSTKHVTSTSVFVEQFQVLPSGLGCSQWDHRFSISDHRPVSATLVLASKKNDIETEMSTTALTAAVSVTKDSF